jgi:LmbE family N-acetylglucosaminyl deacetylase
MVSRGYAGVMARAALVCAALLLVACAGTARAAEPCTSKVMYVVAHADDTLLFQSPDILRDVRSNHCVRTVFVTAGDAGKAASYWEGREAGAEVAYALMAGVSNSWTGSQIEVDGHAMRLEVLDGQPGVSIVYMRLPDGGIAGNGFPLYGEQSLRKLWNGGNAGTPAISSIEAVDDSASYGYQDLIDTLAELMDSFEARQVATQNYLQSYPGPDHPDHVYTGYFARKAHQQYADAHRLSGYMDYETSVLPENVSGSLLSAKQQAFYEYGKHDSEACVSQASCTGTSYEKWLLRQYVAGRETTGVVANAGYAQLEAAASAAVSLDGSESSTQSGNPLQYVWTQTGGPAVTLSGAGTATPSFLTPPHPTLLTFSLVVKDGLTSSAPDVVKVRVPTLDPTPAAIAGPDRSVTAGAPVQLDGTESWDPNSLPLQYSWSQTGGPSVTLTGAKTATPSFTAPVAPATLVFSLTVSNGTQTSAPSSVTVVVGGAKPAPPPSPGPTPGGGSAVGGSGGGAPSQRPPSGSKQELRVRLSKSKVTLKLGKATRHVIKVLPKPTKVRCAGVLPAGARCRVTGRRDVLVEGSRKLMRTGTFRLWILSRSPEGASQRPLTVVVRRSNQR